MVNMVRIGSYRVSLAAATLLTEAEGLTNMKLLARLDQLRTLFNHEKRALDVLPTELHATFLMDPAQLTPTPLVYSIVHALVKTPYKDLLANMLHHASPAVRVQALSDAIDAKHMACVLYLSLCVGKHKDQLL
jgi:hypothetical protein